MIVLILLKIAVGLALAGLTAVVLLSKCFFLAPYPLGWVVMATNVVYETLWKKAHWRRWPIDAVAVVVLCVGWSWVAGPIAAAGVVVVIALAWTYTLVLDLRWRTGQLAEQDRRFDGTGKEGILTFIPLPLPRLIMVVRGPAIDRRRLLDLGDWPEGHEDRFEVLILNPSLILPQYPMTLEVTSRGGAVEVLDAPAGEQRTPESGELVRLAFRLRAARPTDTPCDVDVRLRHGTYTRSETLRVRSIVPQDQVRVESAEIRRWKGGASAGFGWRGDHDLYDPATFQSTEGLRIALGLAMRFRMPTSVYLSGRLSLEEDEHRRFCEHFGFDRRPEEIPEFVRFLREEVDFRSELDFPVETDRPFAAELGNHMYLHYGTHAVASPSNEWELRAEMGSGRYPWQSDETGSFAEQRDNARHNVDVIREKIGVTIRSWGVPGRANDADTGRALEAAGMLVASDCDASAWDNVLRLVPPHHPAGCEHLVELTKKYPGDCVNAYKIAMLKYWMHLARRTGRCFLYMAHHHLMLYEGWSCYHLTEEFLRYALDDCHGDFYVASVSALGLYWERVLCPEHACIRISHHADEVTMTNTGDADLDRLPLEVGLPGGRRFMKLIDLEAGQHVTFRILGNEILP